MGKRKRECNLNDIVGGYLKKKKFEKTLELFQQKVSTKNEKNAKKAGMPKMLRKFTEYSKEQISLRIAKEKEIADYSEYPSPIFEPHLFQNVSIGVYRNIRAIFALLKLNFREMISQRSGRNT